jgi:hypothetical protein
MQRAPPIAAHGRAWREIVRFGNLGSAPVFVIGVVTGMEEHLYTKCNFPNGRGLTKGAGFGRAGRVQRCGEGFKGPLTKPQTEAREGLCSE